MNVDLSNVELFNELAKIAEGTRNLLLQAGLEGNDIQRLGHCGLCGEFMHSFIFPITDIDFDKADGLSEEEIAQKFKKSVLEMAQKSSQLSASSPEVAGDLRGNEITLDAISRSISDLREWAKTQNSNVSAVANILADKADKAYNPIKEAIKQELKL